MNDTICNHKLTARGQSRSLCPFVKIFTIFIYRKMTLFLYFASHAYGRKLICAKLLMSNI